MEPNNINAAYERDNDGKYTKDCKSKLDNISNLNDFNPYLLKIIDNYDSNDNVIFVNSDFYKKLFKNNTIKNEFDIRPNSIKIETPKGDKINAYVLSKNNSYQKIFDGPNQQNDYVSFIHLSKNAYNKLRINKNYNKNYYLDYDHEVGVNGPNADIFEFENDLKIAELKFLDVKVSWHYGWNFSHPRVEYNLGFLFSYISLPMAALWDGIKYALINYESILNFLLKFNIPNFLLNQSN
jgi:hypothetical protein